MLNLTSVRILTIASVTALSSLGASAQSACSSGYRVVARRYDAELRKTWELRQDCTHPGWPAYSVAVANTVLLSGNSISLPLAATSNLRPLLVLAGEPVRVWSQDAASRIEITGIAEQSARLGERINVRLSRQTEESGLRIQHIAGIVRGANEVEIAQ